MARFEDFDTINGLYPDEFDISTSSGREGLRNWEDKSVVSILDPGLEYPEEYTEEKPNYLGQYVVTCNLCHIPSFLTREALEEVFTCPHCGSLGEGFEIAGIICQPTEEAVAGVTTASEGTVNNRMADLVDEQAIEAEKEIVLEKKLTEDFEEEPDDETIEEPTDEQAEEPKAEKYKLIIVDQLEEKLTKITIKFSGADKLEALKKAVAITLDPTHGSADFDEAISSLEDEKATAEYWTEETLTAFLDEDSRVTFLADPEGETIIDKEEAEEPETDENEVAEDDDMNYDDETDDGTLEESKKFKTSMGTIGKAQGTPKLMRERIIREVRNILKEGFILTKDKSIFILENAKRPTQNDIKLISESLRVKSKNISMLVESLVKRNRTIQEGKGTATFTKGQMKKVKGSREIGKPKLMKEGARLKPGDKVTYSTNGRKEEGIFVSRDEDGFTQVKKSEKSKPFDVDTKSVRRLNEDVDVNIKTKGKVNVNVDEDVEMDIDDYGDESQVIRPLTSDESEELAEFDGMEIEESYVNKLISKFLTENYANVRKFKTNLVKYENKNLIIEGRILYESGNVVKSKFMFENFNLSQKSQIVKGSNPMFGRGKSFQMKTNIKENKVICEGLKYNYRVKDANGNLFQVAGKV